jgi:hypothetical protein
MKFKTIALVLALLLIASVSVWAQTITKTPDTITNTNLSVDAGKGHISRGCMLCHTPHLTGTVQQAAATGLTNNNSSLGVPPGNPAGIGSAWVGGPTSGIQGAGAGLPNGGNIYLWGQALPPFTYTTWDGSISASGATINSPEIHSLMCLSCHDGAVGGNTHDIGGPLGGPGTFGTNNQASFGPSEIGAPAYSSFSGNAAGYNGWNPTSTLLTSHPVHVKYASGGYNWVVSVNAANKSVTWADTTFVPYTGAGSYVGHPAKLYTDGTDAYVECTSCHEPHRLNHVAYQNGSGWVVDTGAAATTADYIRGPYNVPTDTHGGNTVANGEQNSGFCRSCHFSKSVEYFNHSGVAY